MDQLFAHFKSIKDRNGLIIYDTHIHPFEVLGVCNKGDFNSKIEVKSAPSLLEKLNFNPLALSTLDRLFHFAPWYIKKNIRDNFRTDNYKKLIKEMDDAIVDRGVVVPVAPFVNVDDLASYVDSDRFSVLGTIDIHNIEANDIEKELLRQKNEYKIQGIKLHPNIQRFYPVPTHNTEELAEKLKLLYKSINKLKLYTLFHSGVSYLPVRDSFEKVSFAKLENFLDKDASLFDYLSMPVVLAHLGSYNIKVPNSDLLDEILQRYNNVYLDTAGVNSDFLNKLVDKKNTQKIIFGSDAGYFDIKYSIYRILNSLYNSHNGSLNDELVMKIFSQNYIDLIKKIN